MAQWQFSGCFFFVLEHAQCLLSAQGLSGLLESLGCRLEPLLSGVTGIIAQKVFQTCLVSVPKRTLRDFFSSCDDSGSNDVGGFLCDLPLYLI
jgi:hypothetical protein